MSTDTKFRTVKLNRWIDKIDLANWGKKPSVGDIDVAPFEIFRSSEINHLGELIARNYGPDQHPIALTVTYCTLQAIECWTDARGRERAIIEGLRFAELLLNATYFEIRQGIFDRVRARVAHELGEPVP
jgi:hypothetical protein